MKILLYIITILMPTVILADQKLTSKWDLIGEAKLVNDKWVIEIWSNRRKVSKVEALQKIHNKIDVSKKEIQSLVFFMSYSENASSSEKYKVNVNQVFDYSVTLPDGDRIIYEIKVKDFKRYISGEIDWIWKRKN